MQEHKRWLNIVKDDLASAKGLLKLEIFSTATYHCQQAAEKALKAYLVFMGCEAPKTHDLLKLIKLCRHFNNDFEKLYKEAGALNPFSTKFRYPTEFDIPDHDDTKDAIKQAERIVRFALKEISPSKVGWQELF